MTPEQIQRRQTAWTVFRYERGMYEATWNLIRLPLHDLYSHNVVNAIVESHSLHIRNLCNFLCYDPSRQDQEDPYLDYTDLVERFEEIDVNPLSKVWNSPIEGHPGTPAWVLTVMSDCTAHRRDSYDYNSIAVAIHRPLVELMNQIEKVRIWEMLKCQHELDLATDICVRCAATKRELYNLVIPKLLPEAQHETQAGEEAASEEGGQNPGGSECQGGEPGPGSEDQGSQPG